MDQTLQELPKSPVSSPGEPANSAVAATNGAVALVPTIPTQPVTDRTDALSGRKLIGPALPVNPAASGISSGINIEPGSNDDGWVVSPPVRLADGTHIQLYKDGEAWHAAFEAIKHARQRICLETYIFASDDTGRAVADLLCVKARAGVRVYVLFDSWGSIHSDRTMFRKMRHCGVNIREFNPVRPWDCTYSWRPVNRDHRKLLLIDHDIAGMGGVNVGNEYAGSWIVRRRRIPFDQWRDNAIGIRGPAARPFMDAFARSWNYCLHGGRPRRAELIHGIHDLELGVLASVPTLSSPLRPFLCQLIHSASKSILLTMAYFAPDDELVDELCKAADRGVRVRLMLPGMGDVPPLIIAARSFYDRLMAHGVEIYERQNAVLHAKTMVIDEHISIVGSTNLDYRSIEYNSELSAIIRHATFGQQMCQLFENDIRYAARIDPEAWRHRPQWDRFVQWAVSRARYLM